MVMSFQRFAGDVWNFLMKNPYTEAYQHAVDNMMIAPAERMAVPEEELREKLPALAAAWSRNHGPFANVESAHGQEIETQLAKARSDAASIEGAVPIVSGLEINGAQIPMELSPYQHEILELIKGGAVNKDAVNRLYQRAIADNGGISTGFEQIMRDNAVNAHNPSHDVLRDAASRMVAGSVGLTDVGNFMRSFGIGSPGAAYAAGAAGLGLGAWGAHDIYQSMQNGWQDLDPATLAAAEAEVKRQKASQRQSAKGDQRDQMLQS